MNGAIKKQNVTKRMDSSSSSRRYSLLLVRMEEENDREMLSKDTNNLLSTAVSISVHRRDRCVTVENRVRIVGPGNLSARQ